ncbi:hypothetical protein TrCOL_g5099 [Triparma columacea]|uniref:Uncharacterized protein n=1 Tax=Triparma columacea TaxID=722753 RepID=A0A9W7L8Y0_9STRA|nr:hypothetical protein TrCOL_g5099 [Triparma columacea]
MLSTALSKNSRRGPPSPGTNCTSLLQHGSQEGPNPITTTSLTSKSKKALNKCYDDDDVMVIEKDKLPMYIAIDEDEEEDEGLEDKAQQLGDILKAYIDGSSTKKFIDELKSLSPAARLARLQTVFNQGTPGCIELGTFNCDLVPNECPRRPLGIMILIIFFALPSDLQTYESLVIVRGCFHFVFDGVGRIIGSDEDHKNMFLNAAHDAAQAVAAAAAQAVAPLNVRRLLEELDDYLHLPDQVQENVKWLIEQTPRPQLLALTLALLKEGGFDQSAADQISALFTTVDLQTLFRGMSSNNLTTVKRMVAKIVHDEVRQTIVLVLLAL